MTSAKPTPPANSSSTRPLLGELLDLLRELAEESADFSTREDDAQRWYNQGYARGMAMALRELGASEQVAEVFADHNAATRLGGAALLPWEKALSHGYHMGYQETYEIWAQSQDSPDNGINRRSASQ